jgi:hypothetical protein
MAQMTLRRWVPAPAHQVWDRLTDVGTFVATQPSLDVVELLDDRLIRGSRLILSRRHGPRVVTIEIEPVAVAAPHHLCLAVTSGRARWVVRIDLEPLGSDASDLTIEAVPDHKRHSAVGRLTTPATTHRAALDLTDMLEALARHAEGAHRLVACG